MVALVLALTGLFPGQTQEPGLQIPPPRQPTLRIEKAEPDWGSLSLRRESLTYYPGDPIVFRAVLSGFDPKPSGIAQFLINSTVTDAGGRAQAVKTTKQAVITGSNNPSCFLNLNGGVLADDAPPGEYRLVMRVKDCATQDEVAFQQTLTVLPQHFHISSCSFTHDREGRLPALAHTAVYEDLVCWVFVGGIPADTRGRRTIRSEVTILDESGASIGSPTVTLPDDPTNPPSADGRNYVSIGVSGFARPGRFVFRFKIMETASGETLTTDLPVVVEGP